MLYFNEARIDRWESGYYASIVVFILSFTAFGVGLLNQRGDSPYGSDIFSSDGVMLISGLCGLVSFFSIFYTLGKREDLQVLAELLKVLKAQPTSYSGEKIGSISFIVTRTDGDQCIVSVERSDLEDARFTFRIEGDCARFVYRSSEVSNDNDIIVKAARRLLSQLQQRAKVSQS